tara:strand:+ start:531 stop:1772 length:1242 start_codon:yes stop_codon:yes gene_type:complete
LKEFNKSPTQILFHEIINESKDSKFENIYLSLDDFSKKIFEEIILFNKFSSNFLKFIGENNLLSLFRKDFIEKCENQKKRFQINSLNAVNEIHLIDDILKSNGMNPIFLKGIAIQKEYKDLALRPFVDVDILLQKSEILKACKILHDENFLRSHEDLFINEGNINEILNNFHHICLVTRNNITIEIHHRLTLKRDFLSCPITQEFFKDTRVINYYGETINIPSLKNMIIHQLFHFSLNSGFIGLLRTINDMKHIQHNYQVNWQELIESIKDIKLRKSICLSLEILNLNNIPIKDFLRIKKNFSKYFPPKNIIVLSQERLFSVKRDFIDINFYKDILLTGNFFRTVISNILPNKFMVIYKYKLSNPNKYDLIKAYLKYFFWQVKKLKYLPNFVKGRLSKRRIKSENLPDFWLNS